MQSAAPAPVVPSAVPLEDDVVRVLRDDGSLDQASDPRLKLEDVLALYRAMVRVRLLDERLVALQRQGRVGFHIGSQGEEAAILGSAAALREQDWIFPSYREFGAALWRGMPLDAYVNHMFGNESDPMKGRQMPDHYGARVARFTSISSPVGTQITHAAGFAWGAKIDATASQRERRAPIGAKNVVTLVYFGEGATSAGEFHNGMNFAGVFKVPLVLLCRNNGWARSARFREQSGPALVSARGLAYGIPALRCDGNDLFAVVSVTRAAVARASRGEGATLIELLTSRMPPARDGGRDPNDPWRRRDPIARVRLHLESRGAWSEDVERDFESATSGEIDAAIERAEREAPPALETMFDDVFATPSPSLVEQRNELLASPRATGLARI